MTCLLALLLWCVRKVRGMTDLLALLLWCVRKVRGMTDLQRLLSVQHLLIAWASYHRPNMLELIGGYSQFLQVGPTGAWGAAAAVIGVGLILMPRATLLLLLWQSFSAAFFFLFALLVTGKNGLTYGTVIYSSLAVASALIAYHTATELFDRTRSPQRLRAWVVRRNG